MLHSLHDRMPVVVQPEDFTRWLDPTIREAAKVADLLRPAPNADWEITQVGTLVNSPRHDVPECLAPLCQNDTLFDV
jgi:putative SOS response-associated peptidase YedK